MTILLKKMGLAAALMMVMAAANAAPKLEFSDKQLKLNVGEQLTFSLTVKQAEKLDGGGFNLSFDPAMIEIVSINFDSRWEFKTSQGTSDKGAGLISDLGFATYKPVSDSATIATITVKGLASGRTTLKTRRSPNSPFAVEGSEVRAKMAKLVLKIK